MKVYIELGAYKGDSLAPMLEPSKEIDLVVAFEPVPQLFSFLKERFGNNKKVILHNLAAGAKDRENVKLYTGGLEDACDQSLGITVGAGSTLFSEKSTGGVTETDFVLVSMIDFSRFVKENFEIDDYVILRVNIEGGEYGLLEHLIKTGAIYYFNELLCFWHNDRCFKNSMRITTKRQDTLLERLERIFGEPIRSRTKATSGLRWNEYHTSGNLK